MGLWERKTEQESCDPLSLTAPGTAERGRHSSKENLDRCLEKAHRPGTDRRYPPLGDPERALLESPRGGPLWGQLGLRPPTLSVMLRLRPRPLGPASPGPTSTLDSLPAFSTQEPPLGAPAGTAGPRPQRMLLRSSGLTPHRAVPQLRARGAGSYRAVGCPHRHLPPGPRCPPVQPRLPAAALDSVVAPLPPCLAAHTRLSETGARESVRTAKPAPSPRPTLGWRVVLILLTPRAG